MTNKKIYALVKYPGKDATFTYIENTLNAIKEKLGGKIETVTVSDDIVFICDSEAVIKDSKYDFEFRDIQFFGTVLIFGHKDDEFKDCPLSVNKARQCFPELFMD